MRVTAPNLTLASSWAFMLAALLVVGVAPPPASAQPEPPPVVAPTADASQPGADAEPAPVGAYSYDPAGRRDPFLSLLARGVETLPAGDRPSGLSGLTINEAALRGIVRSRGAYTAIVQSPNDRTFLIREGDRLFDGSVRTITADAVIFMQVVNDPLSLVSEREVRKPLRLSEEGR